MRTIDELRQMQAAPLYIKIMMTQTRIREWVNWHGEQGVYVSFSGGKDSTVLLHLVRELYPNVEAVFVNTGLEYPEIQQFVKTFENVTILRPKMRFDEVIKNYGYPIISKEVSEKVYGAKRGIKGYAAAMQGRDPKGNASPYKKRFVRYAPLTDINIPISHKCCDVMKKQPVQEYERKTKKKPILATMADESQMRMNAWIRNGCNAFDSRRPKSAPMSFWTEQDVLQYIKQNNIKIASVYGNVEYATEPEQMRLEEYGIDNCGTEQLCTTGCRRTGCIFCAFGAHLDSESRFKRLKRTHPRQYRYCIGGGEYDENGVWKPSKDGLGMGHVFDELNKIYGDGFIKY